MGALLAGQGVNETARQYNLSSATVCNLRKRLTNEQIAQIGNPESKTIDELIVDSMSRGFRALANIADVAGDPLYARQQTASDLGALYGIIADKQIRILDAAERARAAGALLNDAD
jgi:hypothetical protein